MGTARILIPEKAWTSHCLLFHSSKSILGFRSMKFLFNPNQGLALFSSKLFKRKNRFIFNTYQPSGGRAAFAVRYRPESQPYH